MNDLKDEHFVQRSSLEERNKQRDDVFTSETGPLIDADVIAHLKQPSLLNCLLFSFEGRLKSLLCRFVGVVVLWSVIVRGCRVGVGNPFKYSLSKCTRDRAGTPHPGACG